MIYSLIDSSYNRIHPKGSDDTALKKSQLIRSLKALIGRIAELLFIELFCFTHYY